jgi:hypothetical protein
MPVTLYKMFVEIEERKFTHKAGAFSDDFSNLLKNVCYETVLKCF